MITNDNQPVIISSISFNYNSECLLCTTSCGFIVYNVNPFNTLITRNFIGGLRIGKMYQRSNLFFINGTGLNEEYPINRVCIWDDKKQQKIAEVSLNSKVISLCISNGPNFIVSTNRRAYIYEIETLKLITSFEVCSYLLVTRLFNNDFILCHSLFFKEKEGMIAIKTKDRYLNINAHKTTIGAVAISNNGKFLATSSSVGTIIKIFNSINGVLIQEFRRGTFSKEIAYLGFSDYDNYLLCGTSSGSVHIFNIKEILLNYNNLWGILRKRSNYNIHIDENIIAIKMLETDNTIYIITNSKFYCCQILDENIVIKKNSLLIYKKDPFTPSPKRTKVIRNESKPIDINKNNRDIENNKFNIGKLIVSHNSI